MAPLVNALLWAVDGVLALTLIGLAAVVLLTADLFRAVVMFIAFGLLMAVVWARLHAVDIALAEAAIGAGLTGALFLNAIGSMGTGAPPEADSGIRLRPTRSRAALAVLLTLSTGAVGAVLVASVLALPHEPAGLARDAREALDRTGVSNPVTAVLLNFRAYDTLLETAVLLLAVMGVWALGPSPASPRHPSPAGPVLRAFVRLIVPLILLVGGYVLWAGTRAPGGAFQAGAILGAAGVLLVVAGLAPAPGLRRAWERLVVAAGFAGFLALGLAVMVRGARLLEYPERWAGGLIVLIETLLTISIALTLAALFAGGHSMRPASGAAGTAQEPHGREGGA